MARAISNNKMVSIMTKHFDVDYRSGEYYMFINGVSSNTDIEDEVKSELDEWIEDIEQE